MVHCAADVDDGGKSNTWHTTEGNVEVRSEITGARLNDSSQGGNVDATLSVPAAHWVQKLGDVSRAAERPVVCGHTSTKPQSTVASVRD